MRFGEWSIAKRLWSVVGLTFISFIAIIVADAVTTERLDGELDAIERDYVPLLKYGPEVQDAFDRLRRGMQDAVAAQDPEALEQTLTLRAEILELLGRAPAVIERTDIERLERAFVSWSEKAHDLSKRMLQGATGESFITEVEEMQSSQRRAWALLGRTVFMDEAALSRAFGNARSAHRTAARGRTLFRAALLVTISIMMLLIVRRVLTSFTELRRGFARFGRGEFAAPVKIGGGDELAELGASANRMAERIDRLQQGLKAERAALEHANQELESFSYSVSHDLRAPLRGIDGFSQALLEDYEGELDETGRDYLRRVRAAAQRMGALIDDLLSLSRIGRAPLERENVDVSALANRVARELQDSDPARDVEWRIDEDISVEADPRLLAVALDNLLGNAWKFTSKRARARIEFGREDRDGEEVYFVRDNGAGFDRAYADQLFAAFQRLHSAAEFEGTGIGLATVSRVVRKHGGRVWAEGEVGRGATFFFTLSDGEAT